MRLKYKLFLYFKRFSFILYTENYRVSVVEEHIKRVNEKVQAAVKSILQLRKENARLQKELKDEKTKGEEQARQLETLIQRIEVLKASKGTMTEEEKKAFEKRLRQYIKEVDKCVAFLNG